MKGSILIFLAGILVLASCGKKNADQLLALAKKSYDQGNYFQSRMYLAEAVKLKPSDKEIIFQIGRTYMAENMFDSAFAHLSRADKLYPNDRNINQLLHEASIKSEHWNAAFNALLTLSQTGDPIEKYYRQIAEYALKDSSGHIAFYYYGKLLEQEPDSMNHYLNQAASGEIEGEPEKSIDVIKLGLKRLGDQPPLLSALGRLYGTIGNLRESEKAYRLLVAKDSSIISQLQLATILSMQDSRSKKEEAYKIFKKLRSETTNVRRIDSVLTALELEIKATQ